MAKIIREEVSSMEGHQERADQGDYPFIARQQLIVLILGALLVVASAAAIYFWRQASALKTNPQQAAQEEIQQTVSMVGKHMILPDGETPTVATVTDPEKLKDQPFFARAKVGYKVLIYTQSRKAILYDPVENKIVEVAPLNVGASR